MVTLSKWGNQDETHSSGRELLIDLSSELSKKALNLLLITRTPFVPNGLASRINARMVMWLPSFLGDGAWTAYYRLPSQGFFPNNIT
jgi:hypothetical protein